ncbi:MAG: hypothetical protein M3N35_11315, partial [Candidatus Binatota bacterium]|nr:hypothetical protein [Candidatus Binatota bacterium]
SPDGDEVGDLIIRALRVLRILVPGWILSGHASTDEQWVKKIAQAEDPSTHGCNALDGHWELAYQFTILNI